MKPIAKTITLNDRQVEWLIKLLESQRRLTEFMLGVKAREQHSDIVNTLLKRLRE